MPDQQKQQPTSSGPAIAILAGLIGVGTATALLTDTKQDEGVITHSYADMGGVWTACSGTTRGVGKNQVFTPSECEEMTAGDLLRAANTVLGCDPNLKAHQNQLRAAIRFQNNTGKFCASSGGKLMRAGHYKAGCDALLAYNGIVANQPIKGAVEVRRLKSGKYFSVIRGLKNRRDHEHQICVGGL